MPRGAAREQRQYREIGRAFARAAIQGREERLIDALTAVTSDLIHHLQDDARRAGVRVEDLCPCYADSVVPAQILLDEIDRETQ